MHHEVEFRASSTRAAWLVIGCLGFVAVGTWAGRSGESIGWAAVAFFGLGLLVGIVQLIAAGRTVLKLDPDGFSMIQWGGRHHMDSWRDVEAFWISRLMWTKVIAITYSPSYQKVRGARAIMRQLTGFFGIGGFEGIIPNQYSEPLETICAALNEWKHRYG